MFSSWQRLLISRHLSAKFSRPSVKWLNRFAFFGIMVGVFAWILVMSVMSGLQNDIRERVLAEKPHLLWEGTPRTGFNELLNKIDAHPELRSKILRAQSSLQTEGLIQAGDRRLGVIIQGIDTLKKNESEVGVELASRLSLGGDGFTHYKILSAWALQKEALELPFSKVFESGLYEIDKNTLKVSRDQLNQWLGLPEGAASLWTIKLKNPEDAEQVAATLQKEFSPDLNIKLKTWKETEAALWYSLKLEKLVMGLAVFFVIILALFAIYMAISVRLAEKTRELGVLRALGATQGELTRLFMGEGMWIAIKASLWGLALAYIVAQLISSWGQLPDIYYSTRVPVEWSWARSLGLTLVVAVLSSALVWFPVKRALSLEPSEALR